MAPGSPTPHGALTDPITTEDATVNVAGRLLLRAKVEFPIFAGGFLYLTDQTISGISSDARIVDWGEAVLLLDGGEDSITLTVSNVPMSSPMPGFGSSTKFSDYWNPTFPPEGTKITFEISVLDTPVWETYFVGAITEVSSITDRTVTLEISDLSTKFYRDIGDPITRAEWPQAADSAVDRIKPIALGTVKAFTPPKVRERQRATLRTAILASDTISTGTPKDVTVDSNKKWPTTGQLKIDDEHFLYDNTLIVAETTIRLTGRAQNSTTAATHAVGELMTERAQESWLIAGHLAAGAVGTNLSVAAQGGVTGIYGLGDNDELVPLDSGLFTITNVAGKMLLTTVSQDGITIATPSANPTYRRIDMDKAPSLFGFSALPSGLTSNGTLAKNPEFAAGAMAAWRPDNFAAMNFKSRDSMAVRRDAAFTTPGTPPEKVYIAVEYFGLAEFGDKTKLMYTITETATSLVVSNISQLGGLADTLTLGGNNAPGLVYLRVEKEVMQVSAIATGATGEAGQATFTISRGAVGTTAVAHEGGVDVTLYAASATGKPIEEAIYFPQAYVLVRNSLPSGQVLSSVGKLTDISDVPADVIEKDKGYTESQALSGFHTHPVEGLARYGRFYSEKVRWDTVTWGSDSVVSDLVSATLFDATAAGFSTSVIGASLTQTDQLLNGYILDDTVGLSYVFTPVTTIRAAMQQRITGIRFRIAHSSNTVGSSSLRAKFYIPDPNADGDFLFKQKVFSEIGTFPAGGPQNLREDIFKLRFDASTGYPDGIKFSRLFTKHCMLQLLSTGNSAKSVLWWVSADITFDDQQLARGADSIEFMGDRSIMSSAPSMVVCALGSYSNKGFVGPFGSAGGVTNYGDEKIVVELMNSLIQRACTFNTGAAQMKVRNESGAKIGLVRLNADSSSSELQDIRTMHLFFSKENGPADARVFRVTLTMLASGRAGMTAPTVTLRNRNLAILDNRAPNSSSAGGYTAHDGQLYSRRMWRWQWDLEATNITLAQLVADSYVEVIATGNASSNQEATVESPFFIIESDKRSNQGVSGVDAQEYTRVQYFDASAYVTNYTDVIGKQVEIRLAKQGFDFLPGTPTFGQDDGYRPILISRIFWVFRYTGTESRELDDIAVDFTGYSLLAGFHAANCIAGVLVNGPPLLSCSLATDIDTTSLVNASYPFGPTGPIGALPLQGVIDEKISARDLINSLCEQARVSGFWENGKFTLAYKYPPSLLPGPIATFDYNAGEIQEDSLEVVRRPKDTVANVVKVSSLPAFARGGFRETSSLKAPQSLTKYGQRVYEVDATFLEATYAATLTQQILQYRKEPESVVRFQTTVSGKARSLRRGNVIQIVNAPLTAANSARLEVVTVNKAMGSLESGIPLYEVECVERPNVSDEAPYP